VLVRRAVWADACSSLPQPRLCEERSDAAIHLTAAKRAMAAFHVPHLPPKFPQQRI
jgi:hypothetical protein